MDINTIQAICVNKMQEMGFDFSNVPIIANGRLRTTLGRCFHHDRSVTKLEFSKDFIENNSDDKVMEVVLHELGHALVTLQTGENHGHDAIFKQACHRLGTFNDGWRVDFDVESGYKPRPAKYKLYCSYCNKWAGDRTRRCKVVDHPDWYRSRCCNAPIKVVKL